MYHINYFSGVGLSIEEQRSINCMGDDTKKCRVVYVDELRHSRELVKEKYRKSCLKGLDGIEIYLINGGNVILFDSDDLSPKDRTKSLVIAHNTLRGLAKIARNLSLPTPNSFEPDYSFRPR